MIVCNEEEQLAGCLRSVEGVVAEIIVGDTGSTDRSVEIAESFGAKVISIPWEHDFANARNVVLEHANGEWILVLDADEAIHIPDRAILENLLSNKEVMGYYLKLFNYIGDGTDYVTDSVCRLFRNSPNLRFAGTIHEQVVISANAAEFSDIEIKHYGYLDRVIQKKNKNERNMRMIIEALQYREDDPQLLYALATEYFQIQEYRKALHIFDRILPRVPVYSGYASDVLMKTIYACKETGDLRRAIRLIDEGLSFYPDFTDLLECKAMLLYENRKYEEALPLIQRALLTGDVSSKYTTASGSGTYRSLYLQGMICEKLFLWNEACECYERALHIRPGYAAAWHRFPVICYLKESLEPVIAYVEKHYDALHSREKSYLAKLSLDLRRPELAELLVRKGEALDPAELGIMYLQQGMELSAARTWNEASEGGSPDRLLYLWAQALTSGESEAAAEQLKKMAREHPPFGCLRTRFAGEGGTVPESVYRMAQRALIRLGAWEGLMELLRKVPEYSPFSGMPVSLKCSFLQAPAEVKQEVLAWFASSHSPHSATETDRMIAGLLAFELKQFHQALHWFGTVLEQEVQEAPLLSSLGYIHSAAGLAANFSRAPLVELEGDLNFLILGAI